MAKAGKTVPLRSLLGDRRAIFGKGGLDVAPRQILRPRTKGSFCILRGAEDMATLIELRGRGDLSKEARRKLEDFLEQQARKALTRLKLWLGLKRGRPRDFSKRARWNLGAQLREKDPKKNSWRTITRKLDKDGFAKDPQGATDRMRHGIVAVRKDRRGKGKSA